MVLRSIRTVIAFCLVITLGSPLATSGVAAPLRGGAAKIDITPEHPIRLSGYGGRAKESDGVEQPLFASALAFQEGNDGQLSIVISVDNTGVPGWMTEQVYQEVAGKLKLRREQFAVTSTHTHTGPMLRGVLPNLFSADIPPDQQSRIDAYSQELARKMAEVARQAVGNLAPAELWIGQGRADFGKNRRTKEGPVDPDVPVMAVKSPQGELRAVWLNYACHCTTLGGDFNKHHGDWAGSVREYVEAAKPGALALVSIGCGADIDPQPRTGLNFAQQHGKKLAEEVQNVLNTGLRKIDSAPRGRVENFALEFDKVPARAEWEQRSRQPGIIGYHAKRNLERLDRGEAIPTELPYSVQTWSFGTNLAMVFLPGEVVVDYSLRLKREYQNVWVNAYANDVPCYIPSERIWTEGGYEGALAMPYYDRPTRLAKNTEGKIFAALHRLVPSEFKAPAESAATPAAKSPADALEAFKVRDGLKVELVAAEPLVIDPVAIDFGADGRLWVAEMHDYPQGLDGKYKPGGRLKFLEDTNGDGKFDRAVTLADDLPFPTGVLAWKKGAIVCAAPDILYLEDTNNDGKADVRRKLFSGFATHNYQARVNSLRWGLDGWVYAAAGLFGADILSHQTGKKLAISGRDLRFQPDDGAVEAVAGLSQQGRVRDDFGNWFGCDNGAFMWHFPYPEHYLARNPNLTVSETRVYVPSWSNSHQLFPISRTLERFNDFNNVNTVTSACGLEVYRDHRLGSEYYQNGFTAEPVHNLVRRIVVEPSGATFKGSLAPGEERTEFLASTDNWFRPVEIRTGPDGALWVVDMYRFVIEHPIWIPADRLAKLDVRAGDQQGRLYRVVPKDSAGGPVTWGNLESKQTPELIATLASNNGVLRDLAHRILLTRKDGASIEPLRKLAQSTNVPAASAQSLYLLHQLNGLDERTLRSALTNNSPGVRIVALRLSERYAQTIPAIAAGLPKMVDDPAAEVRYQLAFSLGELKSEEAGVALARLAASGDRRTHTAVLSSAANLAPAILRETLRRPSRKGLEPFIEQLIATATRSGDAAARMAVFELVVPAENQRIDAWHFTVLGSLLQGAQFTGSKDVHARVERVGSAARVLAKNTNAPAKDRRSAIQLIGATKLTESDLEFLATFLHAGQPNELRDAAWNALKRSRTPTLPELLLNNWEANSVASRSLVIDELLNRDDGALAVLRAVEKGIVAPRQISATNRQRLTRHSNTSIAGLARTIFGNQTGGDRRAVVEKYRTVAELKGNSAKGLALFANNCAGCHQFRGVGHQLGPDIATYKDKPVIDYLEAILNPNAVIEPRFITYQVEMRDERSLSGVIENETANSVTLVTAGGLKETVLRSDIASLRASDLSLMPEGLEASLNPQEMADLIAYLKSGSPAAFGSANGAAATDARKAFVAESKQGLRRVIHGSEYLVYPSWLGSLPFYHCRQTDGTSKVEWETAPAPASVGREDWVGFPVAAGMGHFSQPLGEFTLFMNDRELFKFDVRLGDAVWESSDLPVRATFSVKERNTEDANGILNIEVKGEVLRANEPVRWTVKGSAANSQRWFGLYVADQSVTVPKAASDMAGADAATIAGAILNDSLPAAAREALIRDHADKSADLIRHMANGLGADSKEEYRRIPWIWRVSIEAGKRNAADELRNIIEVSLPKAGDKLLDWQAVVIGGGIINGVSMAGDWPGQRIEAALKAHPRLRDQWNATLKSSINMVRDTAVPSGTRYDALRMIALLPWAEARPHLVEHLAKNAHPELQQGSVSGLVDVPDSEAAILLAKALPNLTDSNRALALDGLARTPERAGQVRQAVTDRKVDIANIPRDHRARFGLE